MPPASPRSPLISDTLQTGTSFQTAATANSWTLPVLTYRCARKQRGNISAHQDYLYFNVTFHYDIKTISHVNMQFYVLVTSKGYCANMLPWAIWHRSRFPPVTTRLHRCSQECQPQKPWETPAGAGRAHLGLLWERAQGPCSPWHGPAVAVDTSVLQLLHSQDPGKLLPKDRQGLLLSCHKNVTRKQPHAPSPVIFSSHLFSSISESLLQKALLKTLSTTVGQLSKCQHF